MAVFEYRIVDSSGHSQSGTMTADTAAEARRMLRESGGRIEQFGPAAIRSAGSILSGFHLPWLSTTSSARRADNVAEFARHLSLLLRSGVPLAEGMDVLVGQYGNNRFQTVLRDLRSKIGAGSSLAEAMAQYSDWFDPVFLSAVRVGEQAGSLDDALGQLAAFLKERGTLKNKIASALTYPVILLVLGIGVALFLMSYVIPQLLTILTASGKPLPASTAILKSCSDLLLGYWPWLLLAILGLAAGLAIVLAKPTGKRIFHQSLLRIPWLGSLIRKTLVARFAQQMAMLLNSGITFTAAIAVIREGCTNLIMAEELEAIEQTVAAGSDIGPSLANSQVFPPLVVHLVTVGQDAGELPEMLAELKEGYKTEVNLALGKFTAALEPLLIVLLAGMIGFIVFATVMPILQATDVMR